MSDPKPCPDFRCKGPAAAHQEDGKWTVRCDVCRCPSGEYKERDMAVEVWNLNAAYRHTRKQEVLRDSYFGCMAEFWQSQEWKDTKAAMTEFYDEQRSAELKAMRDREKEADRQMWGITPEYQDLCDSFRMLNRFFYGSIGAVGLVICVVLFLVEANESTGWLN